MKQYFDHIKAKEPHHRRQHAMQIAGAVTAAVFVVWITTLGLRLGGTAQLAESEQSTMTAAAINAYGAPNQLMVAPTSGF